MLQHFAVVLQQMLHVAVFCCKIATKQTEKRRWIPIQKIYFHFYFPLCDQTAPLPPLRKIISVWRYYRVYDSSSFSLVLHMISNPKYRLWSYLNFYLCLFFVWIYNIQPQYLQFEWMGTHIRQYMPISLLETPTNKYNLRNFCEIIDLKTNPSKSSHKKSLINVTIR